MSGIPLAGLYDAGLIVLSYSIAVFSAYSAIDLMLRTRARGERWRLLAALVLGGGLWAAHLIGRQPLARAAASGYDFAPLFCAAAVVLALAASGVALWIVSNLGRLSRNRQPPARLVAAALVGLAALGIDYTRLAATAFPAGATGTAAERGSLATVVTILLALGVLSLLLAALDAHRQRRVLAQRQRLAEQERARLLALRDPLTGLGNRAAFQQEVADFIREANRSGGGFDLYHCDIRFATGTASTLSERALAALASRLRAATRADDRLIHYGEGQFVLLCARTGTGRSAKSTPVRERLLAACAQPIAVETARLTVAAEIGSAAYPQDGASARQLMSAAMHAAQDQRVVVLRSSAA